MNTVPRIVHRIKIWQEDIIDIHMTQILTIFYRKLLVLTMDGKNNNGWEVLTSDRCWLIILSSICGIMWFLARMLTTGREVSADQHHQCYSAKISGLIVGKISSIHMKWINGDLDPAPFRPRWILKHRQHPMAYKTFDFGKNPQNGSILEVCIANERNLWFTCF